MDETSYDQPLQPLAKLGVNILGVTQELSPQDSAPCSYIVIYEYQWRRHGQPVWSKDYIRVQDNRFPNRSELYGLIREQVRANREELED